MAAAKWLQLFQPSHPQTSPHRRGEERNLCVQQLWIRHSYEDKHALGIVSDLRKFISFHSFSKYCMSTKCQAVLGAEGTQRCEISRYNVYETSIRKTSWVAAAETLVRNDSGH